MPFGQVGKAMASGAIMRWFESSKGNSRGITVNVELAVFVAIGVPASAKTNCVNLPDREYIVLFYFIMWAEGLVQALME